MNHLHENLRNLCRNVEMCLDCGVLTLKIENTNQKITFVKPKRYNCPISINPLVIFQNIMKSFTENKENSMQFTELYKQVRKGQMDYLRNLTLKCKAPHRCFYLALAYLDRVLGARKTASLYKCHVITVSCFLLALKFNDNDCVIPNYSSFTGANGKQKIKSGDIRKWELKALKMLQYKLNIVTSYNILEILMLGGIVYTDEVYLKPNEFIKNIYSHANKLLYKIMTNAIITEYYNCVQIAFSVVYISRKVHGLNVYFRKKLMQIYDIQFGYYKECLKDISRYVLNSQPDQPEATQTENTSPSPPKVKKAQFNEEISNSSDIKRTTSLFGKLPNIAYTSFLTENSSNTTINSAIKPTSRSIFAKELISASRNKYSLLQSGHSTNDLYEYVAFHDRIIRPKEKLKSMGPNEIIRSFRVSLPLI